LKPGCVGQLNLDTRKNFGNRKRTELSADMTNCVLKIEYDYIIFNEMQMSKRGRTDSEKYLKFIASLSDVLQNDPHRTPEEMEEIVTELRNFAKQAESILSQMMNAPRAFSIVKYNDLYRMNDIMQWNLPKDLFELPEYEPDVIRVPIKMLEVIKNQIQMNTYTIGVLSELNNESKKKKFIDAFVDPCIQLFKGEITNDIEGALDSITFSGRIEYILKAFSETIIVIIEAKKDIEYQSNYGQIMAQLHNAWCHNDREDLPVYGILTTGSDWRWWKYDGKTFSTSPQTTNLRRVDKKSIPFIASKLYSIVIESWVRCCEDNTFELAKNAIWNAKTDEEACKAFDQFKREIDALRLKHHREEYEWSLDPNYI
jgi:Oligopeptidase F